MNTDEGTMPTITEDDMSKVHDILRRAADAIVGMSQLKADVDQLRAQVAQMTDEIDRYRKANAGLEESLYQSRQQREALTLERDEANQKRHQAESEYTSISARLNDLEAILGSTKSSLEAAEKSRDDAELRVMELEDQLKAAQAKLEAIKDGYRSIFGEVPKEPEPTTMTVPQGDPMHMFGDTDASKPYHWDPINQRYVND